jgi:hypothetical protein
VHAYRQDDYYAYLKQVFRYVRHKFDLANLPPSPEKLHHVPTEVAHSISLHVLRHLLLTWLKKSIFSITRGDGSKTRTQIASESHRHLAKFTFTPSY